MDEHGFLASQATGKTYIKPLDRDWKEVTYAVVGDRAIFEGCIILGTVADARAIVRQIEEHPGLLTPGAQPFGIVIAGVQFRWPDRRVPYEIDPGLPDPQRVRDAIDHWHAKTQFKFVARAAGDPNYVVFRPGDGCASAVGCRGGRQEVVLGPACTAGNCIHEIGHTVGLWHEQSRSDRDDFIEIKWDNIAPSARHNFNQHVLDGLDLGAYDYESIMHYPRNAFSINGRETVVPRTQVDIGQRRGLSAGDVAAIANL